MVVLTSGFVIPPTDGSIQPALAIDFHCTHNPHHTFAILYHRDEPSPTTITYEKLTRAVHRVAYILNPQHAIPQGTPIGVLVSASSLEYIIIILGAMRAGLVPFPISPRVHPSGIAHLLTATQTLLVLAGGNDAISSVTAQLSTILGRSNFSVNFMELSTLGDVLSFDEASKDQFEPLPSLEQLKESSIITILHSSGSTGMPKAIKYHLKGVIKNIIKRPHGWASSELVGTMTLPTFHCLGMVIQVLEPLYVGYTQVLFAPARPGVPVVPNPHSTLEAIASTRCTFMVCVPAFLEAWAHDETAIAILKRIKGILFGGGPLTDVVGDELIKRGVRIYSGYGGTEFDAVHVAPPHDLPKDWPWSYIKFSPHVKAIFIPQDDQDNAFELVFEAGEDHCPFVINSQVNGKIYYKTRDLLAPHPCKLNFWRFVGRLDDQIVLLNGEKINPGPIEARIAKCPLVQSAIIFGQARNHAGVLIDLKEAQEISNDIKKKQRELAATVWPYIQGANQASPTYSRLDKRAIIVTDLTRPLPRTPKGTILRPAALELYALDIDEMYARLEQDFHVDSSDGGIQPPKTWIDIGLVLEWISQRIKGILGRDIDTTADLFQQGMDSLTATILWRDLRAGLHASQDPMVQSCARTLTRSLIFDSPTVQQLAHFLVQHTTSPNVSNDPTPMILEGIHAIIHKYNSGWPRPSPSRIRRPDMLRERVVVTGTTGGLGSHLLAQLLAGDNVDRVWALNRKSGGDIRNRQRASFEDKLLDVKLLTSEKLVFVDAVLDETKLGLSHELYDEIRDTATIIIHNAWQVNFNLALQSFEPNIRGTRNLLDLALDSSGLLRFAFASSASVVGSSGLCGQLNEVPIRPEDAMPKIGYGQSKLVAEKLLESAERAGLRACIVRLGQLTGDINGGSWDVTNWVPSIVASSVSVGCLPAAVGAVSWLPLDIAARSIIDICTTRDEELPPVVHVSHPHPAPWVGVMSAFSESLAPRIGFSLPLVEFEQWSKKVVERATAFQGTDIDRYQRYPTTKIQSVVDEMAHADQLLRLRDKREGFESAGTVRLVTTKTEQISEGLRGTSRLGKEHVGKWVRYWEAKGLFVKPLSKPILL